MNTHSRTFQLLHAFGDSAQLVGQKFAVTRPGSVQLIVRVLFVIVFIFVTIVVVVLWARQQRVQLHHVFRQTDGADHAVLFVLALRPR